MLRLALPLLTLVLPGLPVQAEDPCATGQIIIDAPSPELSQKTCSAAEVAIARFATCGFSLTEPVTIEVKPEISEDCLAVFHCGEARIEILTPEVMRHARQPDSAFSHIPVDRLYDSAIVHELTHALYDPVECPYDLCVATSEYLAYNFQIESLTPEDRAAFLVATAALGKVSRDEINPMILMLAPDRFALKAWAHLAQRPERCTYLESIMTGVTVFDHFMP